MLLLCARRHTCLYFWFYLTIILIPSLTKNRIQNHDGRTRMNLTLLTSAGPSPGTKRYHTRSRHPILSFLTGEHRWALAPGRTDSAHLPGPAEVLPGGQAVRVEEHRFRYEPGQEAYDAELAAIAYSLLLLLVQRGGEGQNFTLFTDSQAAMRTTPPGRDRRYIAMEAIRLARRLEAQGNTIAVRCAPAHHGVDGNEQADRRAKEAAATTPPGTTPRRYSLASLGLTATGRATRRWREDIEKRKAGKRVFRIPTAVSRPGIRPSSAGSQAGGCEASPAPERAHNDSALPQWGVGMVGHGHLLVVQ